MVLKTEGAGAPARPDIEDRGENMRRISGGIGSVAGAFLLSGCLSTTGLDAPVVAVAPPAAQPTPVNLLAPLRGGLVSRSGVQNLSRTDRVAALESEYRALEYTAPGDLVTWNGRGVAGQVVPSQPYRVGSQDCRQYALTVVATARAPETVRGTACRNADGSWELLD